MVKSINVKVDENLYEAMSLHEEINWSGVVRTSIKEKLNGLDVQKIDKEKARKALLDCRMLRNSGIFKGGKTGAEIVREWRDKRK